MKEPDETGRFAPSVTFVETPLTPHVVVWGHPWVYLYWIEGEHTQVLVDSGYTANAELLIAWVRERRIPEKRFIHLLTHSHFDHLGATPHLKKAFPEMEVRAHPKVAKVLASERAVALIQRLSRDAARAVGVEAPPFEVFSLDAPITDGVCLELGGGVAVEVLETPGHTRDALTFLVLPDRVAIPGEAAGVPDVRGVVRPQFLASYRLYLESLERIVERQPLRALGLPHRAFVVGEEEVQAFLEQSLRNTRELGAWIAEAYDRLHDVDRVFEALQQHSIFGASTGQTREAFLLNLRAMVVAAVRDLARGAGS